MYSKCINLIKSDSQDICLQNNTIKNVLSIDQRTVYIYSMHAKGLE